MRRKKKDNQKEKTPAKARWQRQGDAKEKGKDGGYSTINATSKVRFDAGAIQTMPNLGKRFPKVFPNVFPLRPRALASGTADGRTAFSTEL